MDKQKIRKNKLIVNRKWWEELIVVSFWVVLPLGVLLLSIWVSIYAGEYYSDKVIY